MITHLKSLCLMSGASGDEGRVRDYIRTTVKPHCDRIETDTMGNLIAYKKGTAHRAGCGPVMVCAHMDEVGFIIKSITDEGYLKFGFVGGIGIEGALSQRVTIGDNAVPGVIAIKAVHLSKKDERKSMPKVENLYIDIGASNREEAEKLVSPGDYGTFLGHFSHFGEGLIRAKAIDDRFGCAAMMRLMENTYKTNTCFVFTVQEEVGLRGARVAAARVRPDAALVLETTTAADLFGADAHKTVCALRRGAVVPFMDGRTIYDERFVNALFDMARTHDIPCQTKEYIAGGTDAGVIHLSGAGVRTAAISTPARYIHSSAAVAAISDMDAVLALSDLFLSKAGELI